MVAEDALPGGSHFVCLGACEPGEESFAHTGEVGRGARREAFESALGDMGEDLAPVATSNAEDTRERSYMFEHTKAFSGFLRGDIPKQYCWSR